jgi:hypothetical protein
MSRAQLFVFVEGKECDPYFYSSVCSNSLPKQVHYEVATARQIPGHTGGKQALIAFFSFLRQRRALVSSLGGQPTACVFFLDKDVDDLFRRKKRSPHVIYTEHYDVQNYVFQHGDLVTGASAAASIDPRRLTATLANPSAWCRRIAILWQDWIALCLRMLEDGIRCEANYRRLSQVQHRLSGPTNIDRHRALTRSLARRAGLPVAQFRERLASTTKKVERYFKKGEHHRVFKGKWFAAVLADEVDRAMTGAPYDDRGLVARLPSAVAATIDFSAPWADHFKRPLRDIAANL